MSVGPGAAGVTRIGSLPSAGAGGRPSPTLQALRHALAALGRPEGERRAHVHIREAGRFDQRYALLFRDYLRASAPARAVYEQARPLAAEAFPDSIEGYLSLKQPVLDLVYEAASLWASRTGWSPGGDHE